MPCSKPLLVPPIARTASTRALTLFAIAGLLALAGAVAGCGSSPSRGEQNTPDWTRLPARTVDGGYIVYVDSGEDRALDKSQFKAEGMALQDLANECSFPPKGTRIEDHFDTQVDEPTGPVYRSFTKVAVQYEDCEAAKSATTPDQIRQLANTQMTDEIKRYQDMIDAPEPQEVAPVAVASNGAPPPVITSNADFFVVRQQVAFAKEYVILAPPAAYPPGAYVSVQPLPIVVYTQPAIIQYQAIHPELRSSPMAFSTQRPNWQAHQAWALRQPRPVMRPRFQGYNPYGNYRGNYGARPYLQRPYGQRPVLRPNANRRRRQRGER